MSQDTEVSPVPGNAVKVAGEDRIAGLGLRVCIHWERPCLPAAKEFGLSPAGEGDLEGCPSGMTGSALP